MVFTTKAHQVKASFYSNLITLLSREFDSKLSKFSEHLHNLGEIVYDIKG